MRRTLLAILLTAALLLAPLAMAAGGEAGRAKAEAAKARGADARPDDAGDDENRSAPMQRFLDRLHGLRASWLENATAIREGCRAQTLDENASKEDRTAWAHCIRDGYAEWRAQKRAELKELRMELRALFDGGQRGRGAHASE